MAKAPTATNVARVQRKNLKLPPGEIPVSVLARGLISPKNELIALVSVTGSLTDPDGNAFHKDGGAFTAKDTASKIGGGVNADAGANGGGGTLNLSDGLRGDIDNGATPLETHSTAPATYIGTVGPGLTKPSKYVLITTPEGLTYGIPAYLMDVV